MIPLYLGLDTSNYTTSLALCDADGQLVEEQRRVLVVKPGERGLRQSEAVFQHTQNIPILMDALKCSDIKKRLAGICVSTSPRPTEDSYMPVFRVGEGIGKSISRMMEVPIIEMSHQENHIRGAIYGGGCIPDQLTFPLLAIHFSGGTSELLYVQPRDAGYDCTIVGHTLDLNGGQLVDRVGVAMGLGFPAGRALEEIAQNATLHDVTLSARVEGSDFHFSGQENQAMALIKNGIAKEEIADAVFRSIGKTLERSVRAAVKKYPIKDVIFSGGVMANRIVRQTLERRLGPSRLDLHFTNPQFATDNAVGAALLARDYFTARRD